MREPAEHPRSACAGTDVVETVDRLSWLCPGSAALISFSRSVSTDTWSILRHDPAAVLLLLRQPGCSICEQLQSPRILDDILACLDAGPKAFVDWHSPSLRPILQTGVAIATVAESIARKIGTLNPETAWICGLLAPLGWYVACALDREAAAACLADPTLAGNPAETQRRHWGLDSGSLARRVARRWVLPAWLTDVIGNLSLSAETATQLGADVTLFRVVQLAAARARQNGFDLGISVDNSAKDAEALGLTVDDVTVPASVSCEAIQDPHQQPLLRELLALAAENRRHRAIDLRRRVEAEADRLHTALGQRDRGADDTLRISKLSALAEFAAGAGHEINNPLAVISGQAQYILSHATQWFIRDDAEGPRKPLQTIVTQAKRIHSLLRDLMQFARPSAPRPAWFDLAETITEAAAALHELAEQRHVRLELPAVLGKVRVLADREQVKSALTNVLRNAVEAAPAEGWARVAVDGPSNGRVAVIVDDNGAGPNETQREHLFDPFYSGRNAGRGRGLGLSTAWRVAQLQGGDVRFVPLPPGEPTRFVIELPWSLPPEPEVCLPVTAPVFTETAGLTSVGLNG